MENLTREQKLLHDLRFLEDVLAGHRSYNQIIFKDLEFARIIHPLLEKRDEDDEQTLKLKELKQYIESQCEDICDSVSRIEHELSCID